MKEKEREKGIPKNQPVYNASIKGKDVPFIRIPKGIEKYLDLPSVESEMFVLYAIISDLYNEREGYAYPSIAHLQLRYGKSEATVRKHLNVLQKVGLIDVYKRKGMTDFYIPRLPLSDNDFYRVFPDAAKVRADRQERINQRARENRRRLGGR